MSMEAMIDGAGRWGSGFPSLDVRLRLYMERQVGLHQSWRGLGCLGVWAGGGFWTLNMV